MILEKDFIESIKNTIFCKKPLVQVVKRGPTNEVFEVINGIDEEIIDDYIRYYCDKYIDSTEYNKNRTIYNKNFITSLKIFKVMAPNSPNVTTYAFCKTFLNAKKFMDRIKDIGEEIRQQSIKEREEDKAKAKVVKQNIRRNIIESVYKTISNKQPLVQINVNAPIRELFEEINSIDEEIIDDYVRYYCDKYIETIKNDFLDKGFFMSDKVYGLMIPNLSTSVLDRYELLKRYPASKKLIDRITDIGIEFGGITIRPLGEKAKKNLFNLIEKTILDKKPLVQIIPKGFIREIFEIINIIDDGVIEEYITHFCNIYINSLKDGLTDSIVSRTRMTYKIYLLIAPNSPYKTELTSVIEGYPDASGFFEKITAISETFRDKMIEIVIGTKKGSYIESIHKAMMNKEPLSQVKAGEGIKQIFEIINSMDEEVLVNYIRYYCNKHLDSVKDTKELSKKNCNICASVYPVIFPNGPKLANILMKYSEVKIFRDTIITIGKEVKYERFISLIKSKTPLADLYSLYGLQFNRTEVMEMIVRYMQTDAENFKGYILHLLVDGLNKRSLEGKKIIGIKNVEKIISNAIVGPDTLYNFKESEIIFNITMEHYDKYCKSLVSECVENNKPLKDIDRCVINSPSVMKIFLQMDINTRNKYVKQRMDYYFDKRKMMNLGTFRQDCTCRNKFILDENYIKEREEIRECIEALYDIYAKKLIKGNREEISMSNNTWTLFFMEGPRIGYRSFKFDDIKSEKFRYEVKMYMMDECTYRIKNNVTLSLIKDSLNFLYDRDKDCDSFSKVDLGAIRALNDYLQKDLKIKNRPVDRNRSAGTVKKSIAKLASIVDFLISYSQKNTMITEPPMNNLFGTIIFRNLESMSKRTHIIPDEIIEQMDKYIEHLNPQHQLMYEIFQNTGMRLSSVCKLEASCLKPSRYDDVKILKYKPYKLENFNKKQGNLPYEELIITQELANKIEEQKKATSKLREKYNSTYIFLSIREECGFLRPSIVGGKGFVEALNRIATRNNICYNNGAIWHFTSRQFRKTLVSIMMNNNATDSEIAYVLGHHNQRTLNRYYKEINEQRVENLNHEFFKNRFGIDIGEENLSQYSQKEKKILYIDFVTNYRRVPLGYCCKHIADGPCTKESGASACEKCPKICTGKQFIQEWINLRDDRKRELNELVEYYIKNNIPKEEYLEYKEYQHIFYEFNLYQDAIDKINEKCSEGV
ncbi:site-specific integrase [uncultured Clostridium sp.]|uniref:site-specific integrase n=1 Tax=uncultured Clostridium sp. TaxID=59620 RepID=UPI0026327E5D|nr:site-specific integrase [uncultured Clostridium sp.]